MSEHLHIVCPHCNTTNRVLRERLDAGAKCGSCKQALIADHPYELTKAGFDSHVASNDLPLVIDFWAPWCGPCRMMAPAYEQAAQRLEPTMRVAKLNTEEAQQLAASYSIRSIPTLALFKNGREFARQAGAMDAKGIVTWAQAKA